MSWEEEDFDTTKPLKAGLSWEDEAEDEPVVESCEIDKEEEAARTKEADNKRKAELKKKQDEAKAKKLALKAPQALLDIDLVDEETRKEMLRKAELVADLNNAADLFGGLGVANDKLEDVLISHPKDQRGAPKKPAFNKDTPLDEHPLFQPVNKGEFEKLRKTLGPILTNLAEDSLMNYSSSLAVDLIRDLVHPLSTETLRKVISTLNVVQKDKEKQERMARLLKSGGTATGGAGKKKAKPAVRSNFNDMGFKKDDLDDYDDFGDDFM